MGSNYWSCTRFADWVRGTPKIPAGTEKEWRAWENIAKKKKVRYWLAEEGLDHLQKSLTGRETGCKTLDIISTIDGFPILMISLPTSRKDNGTSLSAASLFYF